MQKSLFMKKRIIICVTCIAVAGTSIDAQYKNPTITTAESLVAPPPPPAPPVPPPPPPMDAIDIPLPPEPPAPPSEEFAVVHPEQVMPEIINSNGYEISVRTIKGTKMVIVKKDGKAQRIKLSTWNADRKYYEKKYGQLPPPPPPMIEETIFTPPVIKKDN